MGMPKVIIEFIEKASTAISRSSKGIVGIILKDSTGTFDIKSYTSFSDVNQGDFTTINYKILKDVFIGTPKKVFVLRINNGEVAKSTDYAKLLRKRVDYLAYPEATGDEKTGIISYFKNVKNEYIKLVLAGVDTADWENVINCKMGYIDTDNNIVTKEEFTGRLAGILGGLSQQMSCTSYVIEEAKELIDEEIPPDYDVAIDNGQLVLVDDGEKIKIARGVNSLKTLTATKGKSFRKIKIVEGMHLINRDIKDTFENSYSGKNLNIYINKVHFLTAVNIYFKEVAKSGILDSGYSNKASIDLEQQLNYIKLNPGDLTEEEIEDLDEQTIKEYNTGSYVYAKGNIKFADTMEDLNFPITL